MKDFGTARKRLNQYLKGAANKAHSDHWQSPTYFKERNLALHRAFQQFCTHNGIQEMRAALHALEANAKAYGYLSTCEDDLYKTLPDEFNVRGVWTQED